MKSQNIFEMLIDDPVEFNLKSLKAKLAIALVALIREQGWTQTVAAERLQVTQPRMSNLFRGRLDKFSIDALLGMLIRSGYKVESTFDPENVSMPVCMEVRKAGVLGGGACPVAYTLLSRAFTVLINCLSVN